MKTATRLFFVLDFRTYFGYYICSFLSVKVSYTYISKYNHHVIQRNFLLWCTLHKRLDCFEFETEKYAKPFQVFLLYILHQLYLTGGIRISLFIWKSINIVKDVSHFYSLMNRVFIIYLYSVIIVTKTANVKSYHTGRNNFLQQDLELTQTLVISLVSPHSWLK